MKSKNGDYFNHDNIAIHYDKDVANEEHPIRTGYRAALNWLGSNVPNNSVVLDLGTGTGNTIEVLPRNCKIVAVDISKKMMEYAKVKHPNRKIEFIQEDILEYFEKYPAAKFDAIVSSYTIHHLTDSEKVILFKLIRQALKPFGIVVFVDLMFENDNKRKELVQTFKKDFPDVVEDIQEEHFWNIEKVLMQLSKCNFSVRTKQFSTLSWGIIAEQKEYYDRI